MIILKQKECSTTLTKSIASFNKNILKLPRRKAYKSAINKRNNALISAAKGINLVRDIYYTPGQVIDSGVSEIIKNPVSTLGVIAGKVTDITNPETIAIPKSTLAAILGKKILPKKVKDKLNNISERYKNTKLSKIIRNSPSIPELAVFIGELGRNSGF